VTRLTPLLVAACLAGGGTALAADTALGTFTVKGRTTKLAHVSAVRAPDPNDPDRHFVIVLVSDVPVAPADRAPDRLALLSREGRLHAIRVAFSEGLDGVVATPYHADVEQSGQPTAGGAEIDVAALDEQHIEVTLRSRMIGQYWHYNARVKAALVPGTASELEMMDTTPVRTAEVPAAEVGTDPTAIKRALGGMGYVYNDDEFIRAISDGNADAVALFLRAGTSPNARHSNGTPALTFAATQCAYGKGDARIAIIDALIAAKADVKGADDNGSTALIWAAQSCPLPAVQALIAAGCDVNARAKGGATPLMMAEVMQRPEIAEALKKAGAKPWQ
jgi:Ankyrin repeats (3 copies)